MTIGIAHTDNAPRAIGPYSQATIHGDLVFTAGQVALDPVTMEVVAGGVAEQTEQVFKNLKAVLESAGSGFDRVLKTSVFLVDMADFAAMNEVYAKYFVAPFPARSTVQVARLPRDVRVEIEVVAVLQ